jgi:hypothetical protein
MPTVGLATSIPIIERPQAYALDFRSTGISSGRYKFYNFYETIDIFIYMSWVFKWPDDGRQC